jgi:rubrerythrin
MENKNPKYVQIMKYAMQMELDGHNFFKEKAGNFKNPVTKELFERFAEVEMDHYEYIKKHLERYLQTDEFKLDEEFLNREETSIFEARKKSEHIDTTLIESDVPDVTVLRMAYLIEKDFAEFYRESAESSEDEEIKKLFETLANWEDVHEEIFKSEYKRKRDEYMRLPWGG